jgi:hypothetical protein
MRMSAKLVSVMSGCALAVGLVAASPVAVAAGAARHGAARAHLPAATCTRLWAVVNNGGGLARSGCRGTKSSQESTGHYLVTFPRNVLKCVWIATLGTSGTTGIPGPGFITVTGDKLFKGVFVSTYATSGSSASRGFHLIVNC